MALTPADFLLPEEALRQMNRLIQGSALAHGAEGENPSEVAVTFEFHPLGRIVTLRCSGGTRVETILED